MEQLLSSFGKKGVRLGLDTLKVDIEDTSFLSKYFVVSEFNTLFTAGKNPVSFNGSPYLKPNSEIQVECLDSNGNSLYTEYPKSNVLFLAISNYVISIHVYNETYNGPGQLILVGTTIKGEVVRWKANITIDKTLQNVSKVIFYNKPVIEARGLLYPIVTNDSATILTKTIQFNGYVYAEPVNPPADTNKKTINYKKTDIDYRITLNVENDLGSSMLYPTKSFNSQMEGQSITLVAEAIHVPFTNITDEANITGSFTIKKVLSDNTLQITEPIFYTSGKDQIVTTVDRGFITGSYIWIAYDTRTEAYNPDFHDSYAEIVYRNIKTFSGFVARHKLYRKSVVYPGEFELLVDEPTTATEILVDPVTNNKVYNLMGTFYNQLHIDKYWFPTTGITLQHSTNPKINAMKIGGAYDNMNGAEYVIVKADSPGISNTAEFQTIVYDESEFNNMYGVSYNTSFINLKANSQYALSMNISIEKEKTAKGSVKFYYYSTGGSDITIEQNYEEEYGLLIGEISTDEITTLKTFSEKQSLFFTPLADYYGTLIIVPINCNVTLSDFSLKIYGDYGFSPDTMVIKIPFPINVAGESFQIKSELFDINSSLIYSDLQTIKTLDENGISTYTRIGDTSVSGLTSNTVLQPSGLTPVSAGPQYITLTTVQNNISVVAQSIAIAQGYHIWVDENGTKTKYYDV